MSLVRKYPLYLAWAIALIASLSSIYYAEVLDFEPCRLCWYQRIAMFPLAFLLGVAFYKNDGKMARVCLPLALFGLIVSFYHSLIQLFPSLQVVSLCAESSCTTAGVIPYFSFLGFCLITSLILKPRF